MVVVGTFSNKYIDMSRYKLFLFLSIFIRFDEIIEFCE